MVFERILLNNNLKSTKKLIAPKILTFIHKTDYQLIIIHLNLIMFKLC